MTHAIVLAGGRLERDRFPGLDTAIPCKAAIPLLGKPMVWWTVRALTSCPSIQRITVVGNPAISSPELAVLGVAFVKEGDSIAATLRAGLDATPDADRILCISADVPLLSPEAVADLQDHSTDCDVAFPYVERADIEIRFPTRGWIFAKTRDGELTGCSLFVANRAVLLDRWEWVETLLNARRRSVLGLAMLVGPVFVLKYLLRRLHVSDVEKRMSALLGVQARGYRTTFAELAMDVDKTGDIAIVENALRKR